MPRIHAKDQETIRKQYTRIQYTSSVSPDLSTQHWPATSLSIVECWKVETGLGTSTYSSRVHFLIGVFSGFRKYWTIRNSLARQSYSVFTKSMFSLLGNSVARIV